MTERGSTGVEHIRRTLGALADVERASRSGLDAVLAELCRLRISRLLESDAELARRGAGAVAAGLEDKKVEELSRWPTSPRFSGRERSALGFAEQFIVDVSGVDQPLVEGLLEHLTWSEVYLLARYLQAAEARQRTELLLRNDPELGRIVAALADRALAGARPVSPASTPRPELPSNRHGAPDLRALEHDELRAATDGFDAALAELDAVDPVSRELVRLRNAHHQQCHL